MPPAKRTPDRLPRDAYHLVIRQTPEVGKALGSKEKDRKPIDPPPIVQLQIRDYSDPAQNYLQSPYYMCVCSLWDATDDHNASDPILAGTLVSSLHRLKDTDNTDAGFFVFPDLSVKPEGEFRLKFTLWEILDGETLALQSIISPKFTVYPSKTFPGLAESTFLTRTFSDQGVRLRIRKEMRSVAKRTASELENPPYPQRQDAANMHNQAAYGHNAAYNAGHGRSGAYPMEYGQPTVVKRQRSTGSSPSYTEREGWGYSQPPGSAGLYQPAGQSASSHSQESVPSNHGIEYGYRGQPPEGYGYRPMGEYGQPPHSAGYDGQGRIVPQYASTGMSQYQDPAAYGSIPTPDSASTLSPTSTRPPEMRQPVTYHQQPQYRSPSTPGTGPGQHVLPPISSASSSHSSSQAVPASPAYNGYPTPDGRFPPHGQQQGVPSNVRNGGNYGYGAHGTAY